MRYRIKKTDLENNLVCYLVFLTLNLCLNEITTSKAQLNI